LSAGMPNLYHYRASVNTGMIQGVSRSAAVVLAYLIRNRNMTLDNAIVYLRHKRACVKPNSSFIQALQDWEATTSRPGLSRRFTA